MQNSNSGDRWRRFKHFYFAPLRGLARMIRIFDANRRRASAFASRRRVAGMLRVLSLLTLLAWLLIWALANEAQRNALSQAVQDYWQQNFGASSTDDQGAH